MALTHTTLLLDGVVAAEFREPMQMTILVVVMATLWRKQAAKSPPHFATFVGVQATFVEGLRHGLDGASSTQTPIQSSHLSTPNAHFACFVPLKNGPQNNHFLT